MNSAHILQNCCQKCGQKFQNRKATREHFHKHHRKIDFPCSVNGCRFRFKFKKDINRHYKLFHSDLPTSRPNRKPVGIPVFSLVPIHSLMTNVTPTVQTHHSQLVPVIQCDRPSESKQPVKVTNTEVTIDKPVNSEPSDSISVIEPSSRKESTQQATSQPGNLENITSTLDAKRASLNNTTIVKPATSTTPLAISLFAAINSLNTVPTSTGYARRHPIIALIQCNSTKKTNPASVTESSSSKELPQETSQPKHPISSITDKVEKGNVVTTSTDSTNKTNTLVLKEEPCDSITKLNSNNKTTTTSPKKIHRSERLMKENNHTEEAKKSCLKSNETLLQPTSIVDSIKTEPSDSIQKIEAVKNFN